MAEKDFLGDRKKALEDSFFAKENERLLARLRSEKHEHEAIAGLKELSGISDGAVITKLVALGIERDTWTALSLVPLVEVAWANGSVDEKERRAVLSAAEANGVPSASPSYLLLESWLARRPGGQLLEAWGEYIVALCAELSPADRTALRDQIVGRAEAVAEASGGLLGLGNKVSAEEEVVLSELRKAFER